VLIRAFYKGTGSAIRNDISYSGNLEELSNGKELEQKAIESSGWMKGRGEADCYQIEPPSPFPPSHAFFNRGSLFYVCQNQVIQIGYEISNAVKEERVLNEESKKLRLEIATLKSYARMKK